MKCPNCAVDCAAGAAECAACGVIFAKFKKKLELESAPVPSTYNPWIGRAIAAALVAVWVLGFGLYYRRRVSGMRVKYPHGTMTRQR